MTKKTETKRSPWVTITALLCITALELFALSQGINGAMLTIVVGILAAIVGITIPTPKFLK